MQFLAHLLLPQETNNFRSKTLHPSGLLFLTVFFLVIYILRVPTHISRILGYTAERLPAQRLIEFTNQKRMELGLVPLKADPELSKAAEKKGKDMIAWDYWAHVGPDGKAPWSFFDSAGYEYRYAGENLARDFDSPESVVDAWMASPSHRKNLLSDKYEDIGIAVVEGDLGGNPTTLVVQLLGTRAGSGIARLPDLGSPTTPISLKEEVNSIPVSGYSAQPPSPFALQRTIAIGLIGILLLVLALDALVIWNKKIIRIAGRNLAHFSFLVGIVIILFIVERGSVALR